MSFLSNLEVSTSLTTVLVVVAFLTGCLEGTLPLGIASPHMKHSLCFLSISDSSPASPWLCQHCGCKQQLRRELCHVLLDQTRLKLGLECVPFTPSLFFSLQGRTCLVFAFFVFFLVSIFLNISCSVILWLQITTQCSKVITQLIVSHAF